MGPIDYSTNYSCGLLIDGFQWPPRLMMNHNPSYYEALLASWGLEKSKDLYAWWFDCRNPDIQRWRQRVERLRQRSKITIRAMPTRFRCRTGALQALVPRVLEGQLGLWRR